MSIIKIKDRRKTNIIYRKIYGLWYNIKNRCYNESHQRYRQYGGVGVTMCDKWLEFDGFLEEVDLIEGFDLELLLQGKIHLDKDSVDLSNKIYCLEKCRFITKEENNKYKPNQQKYIIATTPLGEEIEFFNQSEFARNNNLRQSSIADCLSGKCKSHKKWKFRYK